jgi:hypothetical protein
MVTEADHFRRIHDAFKRGDLDALREAAGDPSLVPDGPLPVTIGSCLVYAIYHSPLSFIRQLLEIGANPNAPVNDGFPPLIAALTCGRNVPGASRRTDVEDILRLLLSFGADPNQRGTNDYTPLHMAVAERNPQAVQILIDAGADCGLATRIDDYETPLEMAQRAGLTAIATLLNPAEQPVRRRLRSGVTVLAEMPGTGDLIRRQQNYRIRLRLWTKNGDAVRWQEPWGYAGGRLEDDGATLIGNVRIDRRSLINGLFYGVEGMRIGGTRRLEIAPHMAYGDRGVPDRIPPGAMLIAEITFLEKYDPQP